MMNKHQKFALWLGIIVMVWMGVYPPWTITLGHAGGVHTGGYARLLTKPDTLHQKTLEPIGVKLNEASQLISASFGLRLDVDKTARSVGHDGNRDVRIAHLVAEQGLPPFDNLMAPFLARLRI